MHVLYFCICTSSAQLSRFHMERHSRNTLIIIIIIITYSVTVAGNLSSSTSSERSGRLASGPARATFIWLYSVWIWVRCCTPTVLLCLLVGCSTSQQNAKQISGMHACCHSQNNVIAIKSLSLLLLTIMMTFEGALLDI